MALRKIDLIPTQIDSLGDTQTMAGHEQHQRGVSPTVTALANSLYQLLELVGCEIPATVTALLFHIVSVPKYSNFPHFTVWRSDCGVLN
jgi:hypothetical protein